MIDGARNGDRGSCLARRRFGSTFGGTLHMTDHDRVLAVALHRFAMRCRLRRQKVTPLAAKKIAAMAMIIGIHAQRTPSELGFNDDFTLSEDGMWSAMRAIERAGQLDLLTRLDTLLEDLTVVDVEGYEEPDHSRVQLLPGLKCIRRSTL